MHKRIAGVFLCFCICVTVYAQSTINLSGTVKNQDGEPVANAVVTLVKQALMDTTGADGTYKIQGTTSSVLPLLIPRNQLICLENDLLKFSLPQLGTISVEIFDVKGNLLEKQEQKNATTGFYQFDIRNCTRTAKLLVIRAAINGDAFTFRYLPLRNGKFALSGFPGNAVEAGRLAKVTALNDTLKVTATGYQPYQKAIASYDQTVDITLSKVSSGNVGRSAGCGKESTFKKGRSKLKIMVGSKERQYVIGIPDDYDKDTPYRLWFAIHPLGGNDTMIADAKNYEYYGMWKFANPPGGKGTTIFCSPQGQKYSGQYLGWANTGGEDVDFVRTMIQKFKTDLCIDTTRIFSEGFSMGGSMSYALGCAMPSTFRAICMHSGGPMSGCDQKNRGPVAMFITHGINDPVCKYPSMGGPPQIADIAKQDGCTAMDIPTLLKPTDSSGKTPVCADYKGCNAGYPCRACIFVGQHEYTPGGGAANTWVDDSTWNFFKQFF